MKLIFLSLFTLLFVAACAPTIAHQHPEKRWTFPKGHFHAKQVLRERLVLRPDSIRWRIRFDTSCRYNIVDKKTGTISADQNDWLKLPGLTFTPWFMHGNTAMVGWRYNIAKDSFELNSYHHVDGGTFFRDNPHLTVAPNEYFETAVALDPVAKTMRIHVWTARGHLEKAMTYRKIKHWGFLVHPYFGGSVRAPKTMYVFVQRLR